KTLASLHIVMLLIQPRPPSSTLFPYTTLFRSNLPFPLRYGERDHEFRHRIGMGRWLMPGYTGNTMWTWHGTFYLHILQRINHSEDRKSTRLNSSHVKISYAVFCLKKKTMANK